MLTHLAAMSGPVICVPAKYPRTRDTDCNWTMLELHATATESPVAISWVQLGPWTSDRHFDMAATRFNPIDTAATTSTLPHCRCPDTVITTTPIRYDPTKTAYLNASHRRHLDSTAIASHPAPTLPLHTGSPHTSPAMAPLPFLSTAAPGSHSVVL
ncbi:hypothetical protein EDB84DRAFT_1672867 [Lactarius hengduanensis]|nr:hypothetical protein EDB84DRAFT_1672867 [Lactarius hengduanensis]